MTTAEKISIAISIIGLVIAVVAIVIACRSEKKMKAIANLHFDEKLAVMASFLDAVCSGQDLPLARIKYDIRAVSTLREYADIKMKEDLIKKYLIPLLKKIVYGVDINLTEEYELEIYEIVNIALEYGISTKELKLLQGSLHIKKSQ
jgi:hypothetical protein